MTFDEWKKIKAIRGEDTKKVIRDFERSDPGFCGTPKKRSDVESEV